MPVMKVAAHRKKEKSSQPIKDQRGVYFLCNSCGEKGWNVNEYDTIDGNIYCLACVRKVI